MSHSVGYGTRQLSGVVPLRRCLYAGGRGRRNDDKNNHVVSGLVVYQGVVQWCCCMTLACDCKVKVACQVIVLSGLL